MDYHTIVISRPARTDRRAILAPNLRECGIAFSYFDAVERHAHFLPNCVASHLQVICETAVPAGHNLLILEDDVHIDPALWESYKNTPKPADWMIALPGGTLHGQIRAVDRVDDWIKVNHFIGAQAVEYRAEVLPEMRRIIDADRARLMTLCWEGVIGYLAVKMHRPLYRHALDVAQTFASFSDHVNCMFGARKMWVGREQDYE
jgi:hypothetical protein